MLEVINELQRRLRSFQYPDPSSLIGRIPSSANQPSHDQIILDELARRLRPTIDSQQNIRSELGDKLCNYLSARSKGEDVTDEQLKLLLESITTEQKPLINQKASQLSRSNLRAVTYLRVFLR